MPLFYYTGRDENGIRVTGEMSAAKASDVADQLMSRQVMPIDIRTTQERRHYFSPFTQFFIPTLSFSELALFCRQVYSLVKAGVPILATVQRLADISSNKKLKTALQAIGNDISLGKSLSSAMQAFPYLFPPLLVSLVATGEANGRLDEAFFQASQYYELAGTTRKRIKTALRYPITVIIVAFLTIMGISSFIIPKFAVLYERFESKLPLPTRILLSFSSFVRHYWWLLILVVLLLTLVIRIILSTAKYRVFIDHYKFKLPIFGDILQRIMMTNCTRTFAILLKTNVPLLDTVKLVSEVVNNAYVRQKILMLNDYIEHGDNFSDAAAKIDLFSPLVLQMLSVGEVTGNMETMFFEISQFYEQEIDYDIKQLTDKIEPVLLVMIGLVVLLLALGIFLPMWNMVYVVH